MVGSTMVLHRGGQAATLQDLAAVPLPQKTDSYTPVSHYDLATNACRVGQELLEHRGWRLDGAQFGLANEGQRMFGLVAFRNGIDGMGLAVGFRNSYDKSMSVGFAIGARVFVCDNLALAGDLVIFRKHTGNLIDHLQDQLVLTFHKSQSTFDQLVDDRQVMLDHPIHEEEGFELLGRAYGRGLLKPRSFVGVVDQWRNPEHEEFRPRNLWSLYNGFTEVYKALPNTELMQRHLDLHRFAMEVAGRRPVEALMVRPMGGEVADLVGEEF